MPHIIMPASKKQPSLKKGTGYIYNAAISEYTIECLTDDKGNMRYGNIEASLAKRLYDELGEKVLIINTGISSMKIAGFYGKRWI